VWIAVSGRPGGRPPQSPSISRSDENHAICVDQEQSKHGPLLRRPKRLPLVAVPDLERTQDPVLELRQYLNVPLNFDAEKPLSPLKKPPLSRIIRTWQAFA
jgi:hypothetical protein